MNKSINKLQQELAVIIELKEITTDSLVKKDLETRERDIKDLLNGLVRDTDDL